MKGHAKTRNLVLLTLLGLFFLTVAPLGASAQDTDPRWLPWLGCWEVVDEVPDESMLCVRPLTGDVGVEMLSVVDGEITATQTVRATGEPIETDREGCRGWEQAEFSADRRRVYLSTDHLCEGDVRRATTGLIAMVSPQEWVDVRAVEYSGRSLAGVIRYRLASADRAEAVGLGDIGAGRELAVHTARLAAAAEPTVDDVIDAVREVDEEAVRAWVAERGDGFELDAERLVRMAEAGVPEDVIDVVVAVSYPEHFAVDQDAEVSEVASREADETWPSRRGYRHPYGGFFYDPFFYSPFGYGYGYGYRGSYGYGWGYGGYYRPTVVVVQPRDPGIIGRVVRGRGYTRGGSSSTPSRGSGPARSSAGSGSRDTGSTGKVTSGGGASSGSSTGRKAKRRGGGDGGL